MEWVISLPGGARVFPPSFRRSNKLPWVSSDPGLQTPSRALEDLPQGCPRVPMSRSWRLKIEPCWRKQVLLEWTGSRLNHRTGGIVTLSTFGGKRFLLQMQPGLPPPTKILNSTAALGPSSILTSWRKQGLLDVGGTSCFLRMNLLCRETSLSCSRGV